MELIENILELNSTGLSDGLVRRAKENDCASHLNGEDEIEHASNSSLNISILFFNFSA